MVDYGTIIEDAARSDTVNSGGLPIDMESRTKELEPNSYMMVALTRKFGKRVPARQMKHEYRERRPIPNYTTITLVGTAAATTLSVADPTYIKDDQVLHVINASNGRVRGQVLVQDTSIDETVTCVAFSGTSGSGAIGFVVAAGDYVVIEPEAHAEGEAVPEAYSNISVDAYDYIMQIDRAVKKTDIEGDIEHYDAREKSLAMDRKVAWIEVMRGINTLYYLGESTREIVSASGPRRHCLSGVFEKFTENNINLIAGGQGFTEETLSGILAATKFFSASSKMKIGLFGTNGWASISAWPKDKLRDAPKAEAAWGIRLNKIITGFGDILVAYDNVLDASKGLAGRGVILDQNHMRQLMLNQKKMRLYVDITNARDIHNTEDAISGTTAIQCPLVELYAQISGIQ